MKSHEKLIKTILPALLCVLALLVTACGSGGSTPATTTKAAASKQVFVLPEIGRGRYCDV